MSRRVRSWRVLVAAGAIVLAGCTGHGDQDRPVTPTTGPTATGCDGSVRRASLPTWARDGFNPPDQTAVYVQGAGGDIVGVLFGPLTAPAARDHQNKILWVARVSEGGDPLRIEGRLVGSDVAVVREVEGGPGPSIVDVPAAGCWRFELRWSGHADRVYVPYRAGVAGQGTGG